MSDIERVKANRLRFLRAVYDLAEGIPSHSVRGEDVAERLDTDLHGDQFHGLAYFHEKAGNTQALETNWGTLAITVKGIAEVERQTTPAFRRERRGRFLTALYEHGQKRPNRLVMLQEIAPTLGMNAGDPNDYNELTDMARYCVERGYARRQYAGFEAISITSEGIDEVEGNKPPGAGSTFQFYGSVQGSVIGTHNTAELTNNFDFRSIEQQIEREGGEDKEKLKQALAQMERLLERDEYLDRGALARFSDVMERHTWFTGSVMQALLGFATQADG